MKKTVSAMLAVVMTFLCLFSAVGVSAAGSNAVLDKEVLTEMVGVLGGNMPGTINDRTVVYNVLENYLKTDTNLEALILTVRNLPENLTTISDETLQNLAVKLNDKLVAKGKTLADYQSSMLMMLDVLAAVPEANRQAATTAVRNMNSANMSGSDATALADWRTNTELKITENADFQAALQAVYSIFFGEDAQIQLAQNGMGANAIASLACGLNGCVSFTDDKVGGSDFAVLSSDASFLNSLAAKLSVDFDSINGQAVTGENVLNAIVKALNGFSADEKANIKTVLGNSNIDLYESLLGATLSRESIKEMVDFLNDNMPESAARRAEVYNVFKTYLSTDVNIEALIDTVYNLPEDVSTITNSDLKEIAVNLDNKLTTSGKKLADYRSKLLLMLDLLACLPADSRVEAVEAFDAMKNTAMTDADLAAWQNDVEKKISDGGDFQEALQTLYNEYFGEAAQIKLAQSGIGANAIAALSKGFDGSLYLTDDSIGGSKFAVKTSDAAFVENLATKLSRHFVTVNGEEVTGENVLEAFVDALNGFTKLERENIKTVLDDDAIDLYAPLEASPTKKPASGTTGGSSSSSKRHNTTSDENKNTLKLDVVTYAKPEEPAEATEDTLYNDTAEHWSKNYVGALTGRGILKGYGDGNFVPDMGITREEIAVALTRALGLEEEAADAPVAAFTDSNDISAWAKEAVNLMVYRGVFKGYDDGSFKPQQVISREEMVAAVIRTFSSNLKGMTLPYTDAHMVSEWAKTYVEKATALSLVEGYPDGSFKPQQTITRAEASKIVYNFMHYAGLLNK